MTYAGAPKNRIYLNTREIAEQLRALGEAWKGVHPNLRRKHIGAAIRKVANKDVVPIYKKAAQIFEMSGKSKRKKVMKVSKKTGKVRFAAVNNLRKSAGTSKLYPGKPSESAVDMKAGYRMGKFGGSHAMLLARGTSPRYRKGSFGIIQAAERTSAVVNAARRGVKFVSQTGKKVTTKRITNAFALSAKNRFGYTGFLKPTGLETWTNAEAQRIATPNMGEELLAALAKALKEQYSAKYQSVMRKYMIKYGNQGLYSPSRGFFQAAKQ